LSEYLVVSHSIDVDVDQMFAWAFWTNITNWDDPPATFTLNGPFAAGSTGKTLIPGSPSIDWTVLHAHDGRATLEIPLEGTALRFAWTFDPLGGSRTRLTQRVTLSGTKAEAYLADTRAAFSRIAGGMARLATGMVAASEREIAQAQRTDIAG
jgi:hypothetical protein